MQMLRAPWFKLLLTWGAPAGVWAVIPSKSSPSGSCRSLTRLVLPFATGRPLGDENGSACGRCTLCRVWSCNHFLLSARKEGILHVQGEMLLSGGLACTTFGHEWHC